MKRKFLLTNIFLLTVALSASGQKIDFDNWTSDSRYTETGYSGWTVAKASADTAKFANDDGDSITVILNCGDNAERTLKANWWKDGCQKYSSLVSDCVAVYGLDSDSNTPQLTTESATLNMIVKGLSAGTHTLLAYMNVTDGSITTIAPINISVNGTTVLTDVMMSSRAMTASASGQAYIQFEVGTEGEDVTISFVSQPASGTTYDTSGIFLNALVFDRPNPKTTALDPYPENEDMHVDADDNTLEMKWTAATSAVKHHIYIGTSEADMTLVSTTSDASYIASGLSTHNVYYWRVDEEDADGNVYEGEVWTFRPRRLAFPDAEGYGRYAIGGRGGSVYHVTSLDDDPDNPQEGTFRYGITELSEPRTIVFDVSGIIYLNARLSCSDSYVTIAGQTAPGKGILFRGAPIGMSHDGIMRFVRMLRGYHNDDVADMAKGLDGLGMAGCDNSIMDHCSVGWTIDEAFSSRNAKSMTLQRTLISEALNIANHPNYGSGTAHGYAATIGGDTATYHHNLLAHNSGRNWSLSGGLDGGGSYAGHHDIFNNVVYNWGTRTTDGGTHEGQFVNNYYKMGPASKQKYLLNAQLEGTGSGSQSYYVSGNIRESTNGIKTQDSYGDTYTYSLSGGQVLDWDVFVSEPFFESYANIESAELAYKTVLSDVGANQPQLDEHDSRIIQETLNGTYTYEGSVSGYKGLIDRETDAGGYESYPESSRSADYDTDQDGMPDWWENVKGLNPDLADNNSDEDGDGYTALEDYLNWLAYPHYTVLAGASTDIDLSQLFAGYNNNPYYSCDASIDGYDVIMNDNILTLTTPENTVELVSLTVTAGDDDNLGEMTRTINLYVTTDSSSGIDMASVSIGDDENTTWQVYSVNGMLVKDGNDTSSLPAGIYILKGTNNGKTRIFKVVKR
ncbi:MAG: T9SS type A sorting domain-containing protein [Prevotellaceae bacterium]|nr:T9SS type A sorting domain-containing protein [Prevotellaceae bacterium]